MAEQARPALRGDGSDSATARPALEGEEPQSAAARPALEGDGSGASAAAGPSSDTPGYSPVPPGYSPMPIEYGELGSSLPSPVLQPAGRSTRRSSRTSASSRSPASSRPSRLEPESMSGSEHGSGRNQNNAAGSAGQAEATSEQAALDWGPAAGPGSTGAGAGSTVTDSGGRRGASAPHRNGGSPRTVEQPVARGPSPVGNEGSSVSGPRTSVFPAAGGMSGTPVSGTPTSHPLSGAQVPAGGVSGLVGALRARPDLADATLVPGPVRGQRHPHQKIKVIRGKRSRRLVRRIDTWTVFKVSLVFYFFLLVIMLVAGVVLWHLAQPFGVITSIEKSVRLLFDLKTFKLRPIPVLEYSAAGGAVLAIIGTLLNVVAAALYNLISDVVGGIQVIVVSEPQ